MRLSKVAWIALTLVGVCMVGCSGGEAPVEGDNPASANAGTPPADVQAGRAGQMPQTTNPPGTGRGGAGGDALSQAGK